MTEPTAASGLDAHGERFARDGCVVVEGLLDAATIAPLRHAARILFAADPPFDDPPFDDAPAGTVDPSDRSLRRITSPGELHPVFATGAIRDALTAVGRRLVGGPTEVVRESLETTDPVAERPIATGSPAGDGIRCWLPLAGLDADAAPTPPGVALTPGDCVVLAADVTAHLPPSERARTALVVTLVVAR